MLEDFLIPCKKCFRISIGAPQSHALIKGSNIVCQTFGNRAMFDRLTTSQNITWQANMVYFFHNVTQANIFEKPCFATWSNSKTIYFTSIFQMVDKQCLVVLPFENLRSRKKSIDFVNALQYSLEIWHFWRYEIISKQNTVVEKHRYFIYLSIT